VIRAGQPGRAAEQLEAATQMLPANAAAWYALGRAREALGQKDAACSTFGELKAKFPTAPDQIRDEAKSERKKAGC